MIVKCIISLACFSDTKKCLSYCNLHCSVQMLPLCFLSTDKSGYNVSTLLLVVSTIHTPTHKIGQKQGTRHYLSQMNNVYRVCWYTTAKNLFCTAVYILPLSTTFVRAVTQQQATSDLSTLPQYPTILAIHWTFTSSVQLSS